MWRGERPQEGRFREFTQADIDVVDVGELAPHFEAEMPLVIAEAFRRLPVGEFRIQVNNRRIPEGFYLGIGLTDVVGTLRIVDKLDKIGPDKVTALLLEAGATTGAGAPGAGAGRDQQHRPRPSWMPCAPSACSTRPSTRGSTPWPPSSRSAWSRHPGVLVADLQDRPRPRLLHRHRLRDAARRRPSPGARSARAAATTRWPRDGRTTYPGVGISIGVTRLVHLLVARRGLTASRSTPAAVLVAVVDEASRDTSRRVATALRARGIPCEVAPSDAKFGKQIRYADRRGIPYVWFPAAGEGPDQVKDIRSGEQVDADAATWACPPEDLRPVVVTP